MKGSKNTIGFGLSFLLSFELALPTGLFIGAGNYMIPINSSRKFLFSHFYTVTVTRDISLSRSVSTIKSNEGD
jgi:hypothetical protein